MKIKAFSTETFLGMMWGLIPMSYLASESSTMAFAIFIPIYAALLLMRRSFKIPSDALEISILIVLLTLQSLMVEVNSDPAAFSYIRIAMFLLNFLVLLTLIKRETFPFFGAAFLRTISAIAILHILLIQSGQISEHFGRYMFIGNVHPNLGGEIYAVAALIGALSVKKRAFLLLLTPLLISAYLMQSRTGSAVILMLLLIKIFCETSDQKLNTKSLVIGSTLMLALLAIALIIPDLREFIINGIFRADDEYRGLSTGMISGRDAQWQGALSIFYENPFFGNGLSTFGGEDQRGAHSPILYSLAMFGISGIIFWLYFAWKYYNAFKIDPRPAIYILPVTLMIIINDRFLNSNPFPLFFYIFLVIMARPSQNSKH